MVVLPAVTPATIPDDDPIPATVVNEELHAPSLVASLRVVVLPAHSLAAPVIAAGRGFTVTLCIAAQPPTL
jgi:hypothetical protein